MDERDWLIISLLYKYKNITKTANALYISQPDLTGRIKHIEDDLGVPLLNRSNRGVTFTEHGIYVAEFANHVLSEISDFRGHLHSLGQGVAGLIKIGVTSIIGRYYLPALLDAFNKQYPQVVFDITVQQSSDLLKLLKSDIVHFVIVKHTEGLAEAESILLTTYNAVVANRAPFELQDLPRMRQVDYPYEEQYYSQIQQWWKDNFAVPPTISSHVTNLDLCKEMVFNGLGYGILPEIIIPESPCPLYTKEMKYKDGNQLVRRTWLACKKKALQSPLLKLFFEYVKGEDFSKFLRQRNK